jgi:hypothetical protein
MREQYEPELDFDLLGDWCAFCEGSREFPDHHFSTILMGVFLGGLTPEVDRFLREFAKYFPRALYDNLVRICGDAEPDRDVVPWVERDLDEKRKLLTSSPEARRAVEVIDGRRFAVTHDHGAMLDVAASSATHTALYEAECDFVVERCGGDALKYELHEALYHIATNYFLADAIVAPLLKTDVNLGHYFEVYLRGGDYALGDDRIVVYTHQPVGDAGG